MKKKLFTSLGLAIISLFVGYTHVSADSNVLTYNTWYSDYSKIANALTYSNTSSGIQTLISYYEANLSSDYSGWVMYYADNRQTTAYAEWFVLLPTNDTLFVPDYSGIPIIDSSYDIEFGYNPVQLIFDVTHNSFTYMVPGWTGSTTGFPPRSRIPYATSSNYIYNVGTNFDKIIFPSYTDNELDVSYPSYELYPGDTLPTFDSLTDGSFDTYVEIDLSDYSYVALSLKDYDQDSFWTNIYTQGRLCLTPVYNYGMTPRNQVLAGTQVQSCTVEYHTFTPVNVSIIQSDIDNHAIYYVSDYDNLGTIIKVDSDVFDITYITSENASSPQVTIDGRSYPTIPYSQLTDSATISTDNNYISGQVCSVGDVNCNSNSVGIDISDLWTQPLQLFKTLGSSITSVMVVISAFIVMLPPTLQAFLYTSFFLVVILGIIKVIL